MNKTKFLEYDKEKLDIVIISIVHRQRLLFMNI